MFSEPTRREILARAVVNAWRNGEPTGLLLSALYQECGMCKTMADIEAQKSSHYRPES